MGTIRLACLLCDVEDYDGVDHVPPDWQDVDEVQSYEDSIAPIETSRTSAWWTHVGICPDCQQDRFAATQPHPTSN